MTDLYARYERLLFAYPREWRRHRGAEIAATYTEMAADGQRWPRGRDAASLLLHGLRTRLGRPGSRLVVPFTVLAMLIGGLCAAAAGARAGWGASTGLNTRQTAEANQVMPFAWQVESPALGSSRPAAPSWLAGYLSVPVWTFPMAIVVPATGADQTPAWASREIRDLVDQQRARLVGAGWTVTDEFVSATSATMTIRHGDLVAHLGAYSPAPGEVYLVGIAATPQVTVDTIAAFVGGVTVGPDGYTASVYRTTPASVPVLMVLAGLLGAVASYLLIGWLNRRTSRLALIRRRMVTAGLTLTAALAAPAAAVCGAAIWTALRHHSDVPIRYWGGFVTGDVRIAALTAAVLLVATIAGATLARPTWRETEIAR